MADTHKTNTSNHEKGKDSVYAPDFIELWKELYFKTESAWADALREFVGTKTFVKYLDTLLNQNLAGEKITRQYADRYFEIVPVVSKKDIARVAELVISLEEKIDTLEFELLGTFRSATDSLIKLAEYGKKNNEQIAELQQQITALDKKVDSLSKRLYNASKIIDSSGKSSTTGQKTTRRKKADSEL